MRRLWGALAFLVVAVILLQIAAAALQPYLPLIGGALAVLILLIVVIGGVRLIRVLLKRY
ncbi:hypothetical protein [Rathayibacter festucae]|uniref:DUF4175 domain-containing protein n=1 Tax=Rathayibacter festucae DSM 15932 TaxID=1328866 RepID=A0A3T0SYS3_9MICO|nr:hypothetical protein [Rathayibacter festucae]AZZ51439.1 hypothetical protein C1I64_04870 [Rathayibacter festucae DSM 15932]